MGSKKLNGDDGSIYGRDKYTFSAKEYANGGQLPEFQIKGEKVIKGVQKAYNWGKKLIQGRTLGKGLDKALNINKYNPEVRLPNTRQYIPNQLGNTINYTDVLAQQQQDRSLYLGSLLNPKTQLNLPPSSSLLDYYPTHAVNKEILPEAAWWNNSKFTRPWSEKVFYEVTLKDGSTRIMTPESINTLPTTQAELQIAKSNEWKLQDSEKSFLASDIVNISTEPVAPSSDVMNMNVEKGFVPIPLNESLKYPKDVTIGKDVQFPYSITDKYINQKWLREGDMSRLGSRNSLALNIPSGIDPKTMSEGIWDQFVAEGGLKPRFTSYKEEKLKNFFARDPITGELKPLEQHRTMHRKADGTPGGEYYNNPKQFINEYETILKERGYPLNVGMVDARGDVGNLFSMMKQTGYPTITGKQYNELFPNLYHGSPHKFKAPQIENLDKYKTGDKKEKFGNYPGFYITHDPTVASSYIRWATGKHSKIDYGHGAAPLSEIPDASLYSMNIKPDAKIFIGNDIRKVSVAERKKLIDEGYDAITGIGGEGHTRELLILKDNVIKNFKDIPRDAPEYKWMWEENIRGGGPMKNLTYGNKSEYNQLKFHHNLGINPHIKLDELGNPAYDQQHLRLWEEGGELPKAQMGIQDPRGVSNYLMQKVWHDQVIGSRYKGSSLNAEEIAAKKLYEKGIQWNIDWLNSPMAIDMMKKETGKNWKQLQAARLENLSYANVIIKNKHQIEKGDETTHAYANDDIYVYPKGYDGWSTSVHESSHVGDYPLTWWDKNAPGQGWSKNFIESYPNRLIPRQSKSLMNKHKSNEDITLSQQKMIDYPEIVELLSDSSDEYGTNNLQSIYNTNDDFKAKVDNNNWLVYYELEDVKETIKNYRGWDSDRHHDHDYIGEHTETRARLNAIRALSKDKNIYDPFTEKVTPDILQNIIKGIDQRSVNPVQDLLDIMTPEELMEELNKVSDASEEIGGDDLPVQMQSKYGKEIKSDSMYERDRYSKKASAYLHG